MPKKIYIDGFVFLPLHIYRRHLSLLVRKMCRIPKHLLIGEKIYHLFKQNILSAHIRKMHITEPDFGKCTEPRKDQQIHPPSKKRKIHQNCVIFIVIKVNGYSNIGVH